ncbi:MAG: tryptophan-rich sensory protein [Saprospiraceae bacterium]|nr:tryptophan-rich sensory protein [Saprospiraceae bacterium]
MKKEIVIPIISAFICLILGSASGFFSMAGPDQWYADLVKPTWNPPSWIFGPVWTILYLMMGYAAGLIHQSNHPLKNSALAVFGLQLLLNLSWSFIFFRFHHPGFAFLEILMLWITIIWTFKKFYSIQAKAAWLLFPYLLWVSFASILNASIWQLNAA